MSLDSITNNCGDGSCLRPRSKVSFRTGIGCAFPNVAKTKRVARPRVRKWFIIRFRSGSFPVHGPRFIMLHFLNAVEECPYERKKLPESRLFAKTLLMPLHRIPLDEQNPVVRLFVPAQQAVAETMLRALQNWLGFLISCFERRSVLRRDSVTDDFCSHNFNPFVLPLRVQ